MCNYILGHIVPYCSNADTSSSNGDPDQIHKNADPDPVRHIFDNISLMLYNT